jgi:hypothetical protein
MQRVTFDLSAVTSAEATRHIGCLTDGFINLKWEFMLKLQTVFRTRGSKTITGALPVPTDFTPQLLKQVIGSDGYFLKFTTTKHDVDFIWYDEYSREFLFWGMNKRVVVKAMGAISWRLDKVKAQAQAQGQGQGQGQAQGASASASQTDEDYDDLPDLMPCYTFTYNTVEDQFVNLEKSKIDYTKPVPKQKEVDVYDTTGEGRLP